GAEDVIVHRLRDGDDVHSLIVQPLPVTQRVVTANWHEYIDADALEILEYILRDVVGLLGVAAQMLRDSAQRQVAWPRPRSVQESTATASGAIDIRFRKLLHVVTAVCAFFR